MCKYLMSRKLHRKCSYILAIVTNIPLARFVSVCKTIANVSTEITNPN